MTKKKLLVVLIKHYKDTIEMVKKKKTKNQIEIIFKDRDVALGICYTAYNYFNTNIYDKKWVKKYANTLGFWFKTYSRIYTKEENLECLTQRLKILKKELKLTLNK